MYCEMKDRWLCQFNRYTTTRTCYTTTIMYTRKICLILNYTYNTLHNRRILQFRDGRRKHDREQQANVTTQVRQHGVVSRLVRGPTRQRRFVVVAKQRCDTTTASKLPFIAAQCPHLVTHKNTTLTPSAVAEQRKTRSSSSGRISPH